MSVLRGNTSALLTGMVMYNHLPGNRLGNRVIPMNSTDIIKRYTRGDRQYYRVDFSFRGNRVRLRGFISYQEANLVAVKIRTEILTGTYDAVKYKKRGKSSISISDFYEAVYVKTDRRIKARTEKAYRSVLVAQVIPRLGHKSLDELKDSDVQDAYRQLELEGLSVSLMSMFKSGLMSLYKTAVMTGTLLVLPKFSNPTGKRPSTAVINLRDIRKMIKYAQDAGRYSQANINLLKFLLYTGTRISEARAIRLIDIDVDMMEITICRSFYEGIASTPKNGKIEKIPLHPELLPVIMNQVEINKSLELYDTPASQGCIFRNQSGAVITNQSFWRFIKKLAEKALGTSEGISAHSIRKALGSYLVSAGVPVDEVAALLRHDVAVLLKHYNKANQAQFRNTFEGLDLMGNKIEQAKDVHLIFDEKDKLLSKFDEHPVLSSETRYGLNKSTPK